MTGRWNARYDILHWKLQFSERLIVFGDGTMTALCPAHDDDKGVLTVSVQHKDVEIHCQAGCHRNDILRSLDINPGRMKSEDDESPVARPGRSGNRKRKPRPGPETQHEKPAHRLRFGSAEPIVSEGRVDVYKADDLLGWANEPLEWRVRGLLPKGTYTIVGGAKKTFKTTLISAELAYAIANGVDWLGAPGFEVHAPCSVIVLINEGERQLLKTLDRIRSRNNSEKIGPITVVPAQGLKWSDEDLESALRKAVASFRAGQAIFDATYGFIEGDTEASNIFAMGEQLTNIQRICAELDLDLIVVHHLKKNQRAGKPDLDDLAWAGFAEWADSWILLKHVTPPDIANGNYRIGAVAGSRQGYEFTYEIEGHSGPFDIDTLAPLKPPEWTVSLVGSDQAENWGKKDKRRSEGDEGILSIVEYRSFELTKSQLAEEAPGGDQQNRDEIDRMLRAGILESRNLPRREGPRTVNRDLIGLPGHEPPEILIKVGPLKE